MMMVQLDLSPEILGVATPAHSKIGASSMYRWSRCPGSVRMSAGIQSISSPHAEEGTRAHEFAANWINAKNGEPILLPPQDMIDAVQVYVDYVVSESEGHLRYIEHRFDLSSLYPGLFGTADAVIYREDAKTLTVVDYKHGMGIAVEVEGNMQLMYYGLGAMLSFGFPVSTVELVIVQPRCPHPDGPIRKWKIDSFSLMDFSADLIEFAKRTEDPDAPLVPGDHCRFCPAAGICPALHGLAIKSAQIEFRQDLSYDPKALTAALGMVDTIKAWCKSVDEFAYNEANAGRVPPGYKLVEKRATRKWLSEKVASEFLTKDLGLDESKIWELSLVSPAQAEKLLESKDRKRLAEVTSSISTGTTLVPDSDKRPPARSTPELDFQPVVKATDSPPSTG